LLPEAFNRPYFSGLTETPAANDEQRLKESLPEESLVKRAIIDQYMEARDSNRERPHSSLGYLAPEEFAAKNRQLGSEPITRTAWPANQMLAGAGLRATVSVEEPGRLSSSLMT
jgi:hypothetical protein